jgi:hypothetical protein
MVVCFHDLREKEDEWFQEGRKKGKKEIKREDETYILNKFEFVAGGTKSLTRQINDVNTTVNYYLFNLAKCFQIEGSFSAQEYKIHTCERKYVQFYLVWN